VYPEGKKTYVNFVVSWRLMCIYVVPSLFRPVTQAGMHPSDSVKVAEAFHEDYHFSTMR